MSETKKPAILTFVGKGGVGKTSLAALSVRILGETYPEKKILAIDADPAIGLASVLGVEVYSTVDDIRKAFVLSAEDGSVDAAIEMLGEARYRMMDSLIERENMTFLAIGRPEAAGCYCKVNNYLKEVIGLISDHFDFVIIDGEAGIEQVNRRVMEKITHLILVSDCSRKGLNVAETICHVAKDLCMYEEAGLILNRIPAVTDGAENVGIESAKVIARIPDDPQMTLCDVNGENIFTIPDSSPVYEGAKASLSSLGFLPV